MSDPVHTPHSAPRPSGGGESPFMTLISAALFLFVGFAMGLTSSTGDAIFDGSVVGLVWMARIVGIGLLVVAALVWMNAPAGDLLSFVFSVIAAAGCLIVGAIWLIYGQTVSGALVLLFGLVNAGAARSAWMFWARSAE